MSDTHPGAETVGAMFDLKRTAVDGDPSVIASVVEIPLDLIDPDPNNPRQTIDAKSIEGLAQSIASEGLKQPITVRPHPTDAGRYMISYGERRFRAFKQIGRAAIPAIVGTAEGVRAGQLLENLQREGVRPIEEAIGIAQLVHEERAEKGDIARRLGMSGPAISQYLKVAAVGDDFLEEFRKRNLSLRSMYLLATAPVPLRIRLLKKPDGELTNKAIETAIKRDKEKSTGQRSGAGKSRSSSPSASLLKVASEFAQMIDDVEPNDLGEDARNVLEDLRAKIDAALQPRPHAEMAAE